MWKAKWKCLLFTLITNVVCNTEENIAELPHCVDAQSVGYVLVSTLDGKLSALRANGEFAWDIETTTGPLLKSSIHDVELSKKGEWFRIIPSLSGSLYTFNGKTIDAIPVNADALLKSSFVLSNDIIIAGGRDVRTYGIVAKTGEHIYECSINGCYNMSSTLKNYEDMIVIERSTTTVRAHESRTGNERWNFSVGSLQIKIPPSSCINHDTAISDLNLTAILPQGILTACSKQESEQLWQYHFNAPIVNVWKWNGRDLMQVDIMDHAIRAYDRYTLTPAIYLGMHNNQLYIHESRQMLEAGLKKTRPLGNELIESESWKRFPWKPVPAGYLQEEVDESTISHQALSVLYNSNYIDGNGYYFYTTEEAQKNDRLFCEKNATSAYMMFNFVPIGFSAISRSLLFTVAFIVITAIATKFRSFYQNSKSSRSEGETQKFNSQVMDPTSSSEITPNANILNDLRPVQSHFLDNFNIISQLGKGGYGIVFEVQQKFDTGNYAVKIIPLPEKPAAKERVLREVRVLAQLEHPNIVRYCTSWDEETLPDFSQLAHLQPFLVDSSYFSSDIYEDDENESIVEIGDVESNEDSLRCPSLNDDDSFIVFEDEVSKGETTTRSRFGYRSRSKSISITMNSEIEATPSQMRGRAASVGSRKSEKKKERRYLFIQMQLCEKSTLKQWMQANSLRNHETIYEIYAQILCAVEYIHSKQLIHRDLKPSNIFFNQTSQIKVGDFGLVTPIKNSEASGLSSDACNSGYTRDAGTALYMSPEQQTGSNYSYKVDVYSLGVILFELLVFFNTESERVMELQNLRKGIFPSKFKVQHSDEYELLNSMLSTYAGNRPTVSDVINRIQTIQVDKKQHNYA